MLNRAGVTFLLLSFFVFNTPKILQAQTPLNQKLYDHIERVVGGTEDTPFVFLLLEATLESNGLISDIDYEVRSAIGKTRTTQEIYDFMIDATSNKPRDFRILRKYKPKYARREVIEGYRVKQIKYWENRVVTMQKSYNTTLIYQRRARAYQSQIQTQMLLRSQQMWRMVPSGGSTYTTRTITIYR